MVARGPGRLVGALQKLSAPITGLLCLTYWHLPISAHKACQCFTFLQGESTHPGEQVLAPENGGQKRLNLFIAALSFETHYYHCTSSNKGAFAGLDFVIASIS